ncbi:hypothetical protein KUV89_16955 [Marinobacter hydrocarbonoclasticus]|nr:hypothetical protein [Marinobacter nauticus]
MENFYDYLVTAIQAEATSFLTSERDYLRVMFSGPPMDMLEEAFERMQAKGHRLELGRAGVTKSVPVLLVQRDAVDPLHPNSSHCSGNHVVKLRTSSGSFLVMKAVDDSLLLSADDTVNKTGLVRNDHDSVSEWLQEPFVIRVIKAVKERYGQLDANADKLLKQALEEVWEEQGQAHQAVWQLLRKLYDAASFSGSPARFYATLGIPRLADGEEPDPRINARITEYFFEHGIGQACQLLQELAGDDTCMFDALAEFSADISDKFRFAVDFDSLPMSNYAGASNLQQARWWQTLTQQKWLELLDPADTSLPSGTLAVTCTNELYSQPPKGHPGVVKANACFRLIPDETLRGEVVTVRRVAGNGKNFEVLDTITLGDKEATWEDTAEPCKHKNYVHYQFDSPMLEKPVYFKLIDLAGYTPGITMNCRSMAKLTQFKEKKVSKKKGAAAAIHYECDLVTDSSGTHTLDLYHGPDVTLPATMHGQLGGDTDVQKVDKNIIPTGGNSCHAVSVVETLEESTYTFKAVLPGHPEQVLFKVNITASDHVAKGVPSEFKKLVIQNCTGSTKSALEVDPRQTLLTNYEHWQLEDDQSYLPVILGPGFKQSWRVPNWPDKPVLSLLDIYLDPRPRQEELAPPADYLNARKQVREYLFQHCEEKGTLEALSLGQMMLDKAFKGLVTSYVRQYALWLGDNPLASWTDLVAVHKAELQSKCLEPRPVAIMLSPMHPVRLAWQCNAQDILQSALRAGQPCPVAGIMDPSSFPDCMALPCRDANGQFQTVGYASVQTTSDYWSVLWKTDSIQEAGEAHLGSVFGHDLGIDIDGMVRGFSKQQVKRSLDEIRQLAPGKSVLRVALHSDTKGHSSCNEGIEEWCLDNLGPGGDEWASAGGLSLQVLDKRPLDEQPEPAILASLTERSGTGVRWYSKPGKQASHARDLSIVDHLSTMNQSFVLNSVRSVVDPHCVSRVGIKKSATDKANFLSMSRPGMFPFQGDEGALGDMLARCLDLLERACPDQGLFDSLGFAPNIATLNESLGDTSYCAISSSSIDASCFQRSGERAYLWDYELPRYAPGSGQASGFYLVANKTDNMIQATRSVLASFDEQASLDDQQITALLGEISRRGIPTLKRLTGGGTASMGEMGMLIACRLLQGDFQENRQGEGLVPCWDKGRINLVIPADVFHARFDGLRSSLDSSSYERPDLLLINILFQEVPGNPAAPVALKITPLEVKARSGEMDDNSRAAALAQATSFSGFLERLAKQAYDGDESARLWKIANLDLLASWIDYGFRVYGDTLSARSNPHWTRYHQDTLGRLMSGQLDVQVDPVGRLLTIEQGNQGRVLTSGNVAGVKDTIVLGYKEATALLAGDPSVVTRQITSAVGDWGLLANEPIEQDEDEMNALAPAPGREPEAPVRSPSVENPLGAVEASSPLETRGELDETDIVDSAIRFKIGEACDLIGNNDVEFFPGNTELNNINIGVVGDLGTGKTQLLKSLVYQMVRNPADNRGVAPKVLILDYKRDFSDLDDKKCQFIDKAKVKVISPYRLPLNFFATGGDTSPRAILDKNGFFRDILRKIFGVNAPVQDERLKEAVKAAYSSKRASVGGDPTIYDVFDEYKAIVDGKPDSVFSIMSDMVDYEIFESDPAKITSFEEFFDGVVAIDLSQLSEDKLKKMVVVTFLNLYCDYMLKVEKKEFRGTSPQTRFIDSYLLVDEAHNIMPYEFPVLSKLLLQGRAFGIGVILASQYFSHFKTQKEDYREPIQSWFIHKVPGVTQRELDKIGLPMASDSMVNRIASLGKFESLCKTLGYQGEFIKGVPFFRL